MERTTTPKPREEFTGMMGNLVRALDERHKVMHSSGERVGKQILHIILSKTRVSDCVQKVKIVTISLDLHAFAKVTDPTSIALERVFWHSEFCCKQIVVYRFAFGAL